MFFKWGHNEGIDKGVKALKEAIQKLGGNLTFEVVINEDGWVAHCKEFPAIVTGNAEPRPSDEEVMTCILDAVRTAFNISDEPSFPLEQVLRISTKRELQFSLRS